MTGEQIIKALLCCADIEKDQCADCKYRIYRYRDCQEKAMRDALNLINRQQAEIETLKAERDNYKEWYFGTVKQLEAAKSDIEELRELAEKRFDKEER